MDLELWTYTAHSCTSHLSSCWLICRGCVFLYLSSGGHICSESHIRMRSCVSLLQTSLPVLDNPFSQRLREIVGAFRAQRSRYMKVRNTPTVSPSLLSVLFIFNVVFSSCFIFPMFALSVSAVDCGETGRQGRAHIQALPG